MSKIAENNIKLLRKFSIRTRIIVILMLSLLLYCFVILQLSNMFSKKIINDYINDYVMLTQKEIVSSLQMIVDEVNMMTIRLRSNQDIYNIFRDELLTPLEKQQRMKTVLNNVITNDKVLNDISIIINTGTEYESFSYKSKTNDINKRYLQNIKKSIYPIIGDIIENEDGSYSIPFGVKLRSFYTGEEIGYIIMYINEQALCDVFKKMVPEWGYSFIIASDDCVISHVDKNKVGKVIFDLSAIYSSNGQEYRKTVYNGEDVILATNSFDTRLKSLGFDWKLISIIKQKELFEIIDKIKSYVVFFEIVLFSLGAVISIYVSMKVINPLANIRVKMRRFGKGDLNIQLNNARYGDEIWELENTFNKMVKDINDLIERNNMEKEKQREMELIALQAQINPHFLYNTLDAIGWIAKIKKQNDIELLVMSLAKFFRLSLHKGDKFITVDEEVNLVKSFVQIEQMRSPDKFEIFYNIQEEMKSLKMLKITLQPLVENSIKHGIGQKRGKGLIQINGYLTGETMVFEVIDDGVGFDMNKDLLNYNAKDIRRSGYGIRNVDDRIRLEYGQDFGLNIESEINKGTKATVCIKVKYDVT